MSYYGKSLVLPFYIKQDYHLPGLHKTDTRPLSLKTTYTKLHVNTTTTALIIIVTTTTAAAITTTTTFALLLKNIFNLSLSQEHFPMQWKNVITVSILKKHNSCFINNYRPISLLNNFSEVFKFVVHSHMSLLYQ